MATKCTTNTVTASSTNAGPLIMLALKNWLVAQCAWTIPLSFNGSTVATGSDNCTTDVIFNSAANCGWVMRSPDGKVEILVCRGASAGVIHVEYSTPNASSGAYYVGASWSTSVKPTATYSTALWEGTPSGGSSTIRYHITAESAAPYGFAVSCNTSGTSTAGLFGMALVPLAQQGASPGVPYWCFFGPGSGGTPFNSTTTGLGNISTTLAAAKGLVQPHGALAVPLSAACLVLAIAGGGSSYFPNGMGQDAGNDLGIPINIAVLGTLWYGLTTYMQWRGSNRNNLDTFGGKTRIIFDHVSFPWDGSTTPVP